MKLEYASGTAGSCDWVIGSVLSGVACSVTQFTVRRRDRPGDLHRLGFTPCLEVTRA